VFGKLVFLAVVLEGLPAVLQAQGMHYIGWDDSHPGRRDESFDCDHPPDSSTLVISADPGACDIPVRWVQMQLTLSTRYEPLPDWWSFNDPDGCGAARVDVSVDFSDGPFGFAVPWSPSDVDTTVLVYLARQPVAYTLTSEVLIFFRSPVVLPDTEFYVCKIHLADPTDVCPGCSVPACIMLNFVVFGDRLDLYAPLCRTARNPDSYVSWQGGQVPYCGREGWVGVGTLASTWGGIKNRYE